MCVFSSEAGVYPGVAGSGVRAAVPVSPGWAIRWRGRSKEIRAGFDGGDATDSCCR